MKDGHATEQGLQQKTDYVFSTPPEHRLIKQGGACWSTFLRAITEAWGLPVGQRGWRGGHAWQLRDDSFVLVATAQTSLKGFSNRKSANEAGNKETINLAVVC